ncbi:MULTISPECIES: helix-turn-helix transcriptional regulator [Halomonadaceae]|jgi:prophage regulatory protein|uniref:helix-turn-helix transcriptional regulator n=1 Tax=Halomonadaceae TaxID=28256 RepID=UPI00158169E9|nr:MULTISPECIES: AlpA family phage regulatory protein [Halomonas]MDI4638330.1 AlpA family transcriptional regulator [Halomonas sp. BMC7]NUJ59320.1 AlpA family phage regulatory protein [Halomonas taeanensis]|tara:strand:+ start:6311 stop:6544 length:234 start_codon:yes stop_codon:yes gene_type:complete
MSNDRKLKILRMAQLVEKIGISRSSIYAKINPRMPQYDPTFPVQISLGARSKGWSEPDVDRWLLANQGESKSDPDIA